jgi:hypothetical protein
MNIRESGMPDQEIWESFFSPSATLLELGLNGDLTRPRRKVITILNVCSSL